MALGFAAVLVCGRGNPLFNLAVLGQFGQFFTGVVVMLTILATDFAFSTQFGLAVFGPFPEGAIIEGFNIIASTGLSDLVLTASMVDSVAGVNAARTVPNAMFPLMSGGEALINGTNVIDVALDTQLKGLICQENSKFPLSLAVGNRRFLAVVFSAAGASGTVGIGVRAVSRDGSPLNIS